jgi:hypothetical protein
MPDKLPEPDEFGRYRVTDKDTGHKRSVDALQVHHGNYTILKQPASDPLTGDPLPPEFNTLESLSSPTSGQSADTTKEK